MSKLNRERKLIEKRHAKQIRKDARRQAAADGVPSHELRGHDAQPAPARSAISSGETSST